MMAEHHPIQRWQSKVVVLKTLVEPRVFALLVRISFPARWFVSVCQSVYRGPNKFRSHKLDVWNLLTPDNDQSLIEQELHTVFFVDEKLIVFVMWSIRIITMLALALSFSLLLLIKHKRKK